MTTPARPLKRRIVDIDSIEEFDHVVASARPGSTMDGWRVRRVALTDRTEALRRFDPAGSLFLGCAISTEARLHLETGGALVFPDVPDSPVDEYRATLYTADELYESVRDRGYHSTPDARVYAWSQCFTGSTTDVVIRALHDAAIESALDDCIASRSAPVVGVMGGHGMARGTDWYRQAALLGHRLARLGVVVATGGGPGAMEAANLGAYLARGTPVDVDEALTMVGAVPSFKPSVGDWAITAMDVRDRWPGGDGGIGVPTWFYGHEPPNVFAGGIAKFFQNSVREATLVNRCDGGVVFLPGAAGTVQEIFQDACENYYAEPELVAPMVLVGRDHWSARVPAWSLLRALAAATGFSHAIAVVDTIDEAVEFVAEAHRARAPSGGDRQAPA
jgi:predicted Rossmann-fold nucleotide-binding protein